jgi:uncharacterized protein YjbJ (UPF0337 family)
LPEHRLAPAEWPRPLGATRSGYREAYVQDASPEGARQMSSHHNGERMKGRLKQAVGDITGDKGLQREGKVDQASADLKDTIGNAADRIEGVVNPKK